MQASHEKSFTLLHATNCRPGSKSIALEQDSPSSSSLRKSSPSSLRSSLRSAIRSSLPSSHEAASSNILFYNDDEEKRKDKCTPKQTRPPVSFYEDANPTSELNSRGPVGAGQSYYQSLAAQYQVESQELKKKLRIVQESMRILSPVFILLPRHHRVQIGINLHVVSMVWVFGSGLL